MRAGPGDARNRLNHYYAWGLGAGGGKVRAWTSETKLTFRWAPSQKGLFSECPHRQRPIAVLPDRSKAFPAASQIVNSPSTRIGPLLLIVIFAKHSSSIGLAYHFHRGGAPTELGLTPVHPKGFGEYQNQNNQKYKGNGAVQN